VSARRSYLDLFGEVEDIHLFPSGSLEFQGVGGVGQRKQVMPHSLFERCLIVFFRLTMAWTFLYAASHQVFDPAWSVTGFLSHTKTFHNLFVVFTTPTMAPITTFLVEYGHLLIGLSLLFGCMVRISASFGILLMGIYWMAHMDWPFVENPTNLIFDYHLVYAGVLSYLIAKQAGHVWGLDGWTEKLPFFERHANLRPLIA
jgi:thiosulfate dehydrogenase [quinone] large subunit